MLLHSPTQWDIICLCVPTQWMKQEDGVLESHLKQPATGVSHQQSMAIVHRVSKLECKYCISIALLKFFAKFSRRQAETIKAIIVLDRL